MPDDADARRIGGGGSAGMQRSVPPRATPTAPRPAAAGRPTAAPATAGAAAAGRAANRSWMGPIAGLAAGLGIAALMSHLGLGAEFGNILMLVCSAVVAFVAIRFLLRRFGPNPAAERRRQLQFAGAGAPTPPARLRAPAHSAGSRRASRAAGRRGSRRSRQPAGRLRCRAGFERIAKMIFIRLQAANDSGDLNDLRAFTTPEMFAALKLDLQERGGDGQRTDVVRVDAEVLDVASEADRQVVSVRFHGLIREETDGVAEPFDEVWHLVKPTDGSREWAIAGIQQAEQRPGPGLKLFVVTGASRGMARRWPRRLLADD